MEEVSSSSRTTPTATITTMDACDDQTARSQTIPPPPSEESSLASSAFHRNSAMNTNAPPPPFLFPGSSSTYLHSKPRHFTLSIPTQDSEVVSVIQQLIQRALNEQHSTHSLPNGLTKTDIPTSTHHSFSDSTETSSNSHPHLTPSPPLIPIVDAQQIQLIKDQLMQHHVRKKQLQTLLSKIEPWILNKSSTNTSQSQHLMQSIIYTLQHSQQGVVLSDHPDPLNLDSTRQEFTLHQQHMEHQLLLQKQLLEQGITNLKQQMQQQLDQQIEHIETNFQRTIQLHTQTLLQQEQDLNELEQEWKTLDHTLEEEENREKTQIVPSFIINNKNKTLADDLEEGEEVDEENQTLPPPPLSLSPLPQLQSQDKNRKIQEKEKQLEKMNEAKSELVWLLKEVIIAEKKRKMIMEKQSS